MTLSDDARRILNWLREEYVKAGHPNHNVWGLSPGQEDVAAFNELRANQIIKIFEIGLKNPRWVLTDFGLRKLLEAEDRTDLGASVHHHGDIIMGSTFTNNISGDTQIGAFGQGDGITVTGSLTVNAGAPGTRTQEQHKAAIKEAQTALVHDQDALERIDDRLYEALNQFLSMARKIQVDQQSLAEVQAKMKETLDEVWAQQVAKGLRPQALPEGLKVIEALVKSPITAEIAKHLLAG